MRYVVACISCVLISFFIFMLYGCSLFNPKFPAFEDEQGFNDYTAWIAEDATMTTSPTQQYSKDIIALIPKDPYLKLGNAQTPLTLFDMIRMLKFNPQLAVTILKPMLAFREHSCYMQSDMFMQYRLYNNFRKSYDYLVYKFPKLPKWMQGKDIPKTDDQYFYPRNSTRYAPPREAPSTVPDCLQETVIEIYPDKSGITCDEAATKEIWEKLGCGKKGRTFRGQRERYSKKETDEAFTVIPKVPQYSRGYQK